MEHEGAPEEGHYAPWYIAPLFLFLTATYPLDEAIQSLSEHSRFDCWNTSSQPALELNQCATPLHVMNTSTGNALYVNEHLGDHISRQSDQVLILRSHSEISQKPPNAERSKPKGLGLVWFAPIPIVLGVFLLYLPFLRESLNPFTASRPSMVIKQGTIVSRMIDDGRFPKPLGGSIGIPYALPPCRSTQIPTGGPRTRGGWYS
jgi:hypothetical protein